MLKSSGWLLKHIRAVHITMHTSSLHANFWMRRWFSHISRRSHKQIPRRVSCHGSAWLGYSCVSMNTCGLVPCLLVLWIILKSVADPGGGPRGPWPPPGPVKIGHKKDGRQRRPHRFHVSWPPPYPAAGSATESLYVVNKYLCQTGRRQYKRKRWKLLPIQETHWIFDHPMKTCSQLRFYIVSYFNFELTLLT